MRFNLLSPLTTACILLTATAQSAPIVSFTHAAMGTEFELRLELDAALSREDATEIAEEVFHLVDTIEREISAWRESSYTAYVNRHADEQAVRVSANVLDLFVRAKRLSARTGGAFDPTVGPLLELWKTRDGGAQPSDEAIADVLTRVGMDKVQIDETEMTVHYTVAGMRVDWGAIGKGYALDLCARYLRGRHIESALLNAGTSTVLAIGAPQGEEGWEVHLRDASGDMASLPPIFLKNQALSTSACYESSVAPCDIIDPRTGRPVSCAVSVSVVAGAAFEADALSTGLLVMDAVEGAEFRERNPGARAIRFSSQDEEPLLLNWKQD